MLTPDNIYVMTRRTKVHGEVKLVDTRVVINWFEETEDAFRFGYEYVNPAEGNFGNGTIYKHREPNFGIIKMVGTGEKHYRPRHTPVTPQHGPSYSCM